MVVVVANIKTGEIGLANLTNHFTVILLRRDRQKLLRFQHDRRAMSVIGTDEVNMAASY